MKYTNEYVKKRLREKGLSQRDLAEFLEISECNLSHKLNRVGDMRVCTLINIAKFLDTDLNNICGFDGQDE